MDRAGPLDLVDDVAVFRAIGEVPLEGAAHLVATALVTARTHGQTKLVADLSEVTGFTSPSLDQRRSIAREWANAAGGNVQLALVLREEWIDPHKFGIVVAANFGLVAEVFTSEADALAWFRAVAE